MEKNGNAQHGADWYRKAILFLFVCCLSAAWVVYGQDLLCDWRSKRWIIPLFLCVALAVTFIACHFWQKKRFRIAAIVALLGIAFFLPLNISWLQLLSALCMGGAAWLFAVWFLLPKKRREPVPREDEKFGRGYMYRKQQEQLYARVVEQNMQQNQEKRGLLIAVTGEWGSGKTHFIKHTVYELDTGGRITEPDSGTMHPYTGKFRSATVDLWKADSTDEMWQEIANALTYTARGYNSDCLLGNRLVRSLLECKFPAPLAAETARLLSMGEDTSTVIQSQIAQEIKDQADNKRIYSLLVLDNLERCSVKILRALFPVLESLKHIYGLVILCGVAKGNMVSIMGQEAPDLCSALLKIFDDEIHIHLLSENEIQIFKQRQKIKEDTCFAQWYKEQVFYGISPRLVNKICDHHSRLSEMYLDRHRKKEEEFFDLWGERCTTIFDFETLRLVFPNFPLPVHGRNPEKNLNVEQNKDKQYDDQFKKWREHIRKRYGTVIFEEDDPTRCGLYLMATRLSQASAESLEYLRNQGYTNLTSLTYDECELCLRSADLDSILEDSGRGAYVISSCINNHIEPENMPYVLLSLYDHCVSHVSVVAGLDFMEKFFEKDRHSELGLQEVFPLDYAAVFSRLNAYQKRGIKYLQRILAAGSFELLASLAGTILKCVHDKDAWNYNYSNRELAWGTRMMLKAFYENRDTSAHKWINPAYGEILNTVLEKYAAEACKSIRKYKGGMNTTYYKHLIIGLGCPAEIYEPTLERAAKRYADSGVEAHENEAIKQLLNLVSIEDSITQRPEPFAVLSFASIWQVLFKKLVTTTELNDENKQKIKELLEHIKYRQEIDSSMSIEERKAKGSEEFWNNRDKAMEILKETLEKATESSRT